MKPTNKSICAIVAAVALAVFGEAAFDYEAGECSTDAIPQEAENVAQMMFGAKGPQLLHAMRLQMGKYDRDMQTASGRKNWHGDLIGEEIHMDELVKIEIYSNKLNGAVWRFKVPFKPQPVRSLADRGRRVSFPTNGIPKTLAEARTRSITESRRAS